MKILYWSPYIGHVGTIKAVINSARAMKKYGNHEVVIIKNHSEWEGFEEIILGDDIQIVDFKLKKRFPNLHKTKFMGSRLYMLTVALFGFFQLRAYLKKNQQDIVITNLIAIPAMLSMFTLKRRPKILASIQGYPKFLGLPDKSQYEWWMHIEDALRKILWNFIYTKVDKVICMTENTKTKIVQKTKLKEKNIVVIKNPILDEDIFLMSDEPIDDKWFLEDGFKKVVAIGRLTYQKDFYTFVKAIGKASKYVKIKAYIFGEGEDRKILEELIVNENLQDTVKLYGFTKNPYKYLKKSDLFVLSSRWEDPGHVILEAAYLKIPIVSTKCPTGPEKILEYGKGGWICEVENSEDMAEQIRNALSSDNAEKIDVAYKSVQDFTLDGHFMQMKEIVK